MKHQPPRTLALMLSVLLIAAVPAQAGTIQFGDVIALATVNGQSGRSDLNLRLRAITQQNGAGNARDRQTSSNNQQARGNMQTPAGAASSGSADASITGTTIAVQQPGSVQVETIELGDVQGTICDCGEIPGLPGGGFPKLPLLALAGLPLLFLGGGGDNEIPPTLFFPTPPPVPETPIPEPATLLLLGSGLTALGAGARRRRAAAAARTADGSVEALDVRGA